MRDQEIGMLVRLMQASLTVSGGIAQQTRGQGGLPFLALKA